MNNSLANQKERSIMAYVIIVLATLTRFIPHLPDFSPVYGALLFGGARLRKRDSLWFCAATLGASDIILTRLVFRLHVGWEVLFQVAAFLSIAMIGWFLQKRFSVGRLAFACLAAPTGFYLISDFGVWLGFNGYPHTWNGLVACYVAAIPFQGRITASTVVFSVLFFGGEQIYLARRRQRERLPLIAR